MKFCGNGFERRFLARSLVYKPTKKKKKINFALENPETVLEWRCERSSCDLLCDANELLGCLCALLYTYFCLGGQYQACFFIYLPCTQWTL